MALGTIRYRIALLVIAAMARVAGRDGVARPIVLRVVGRWAGVPKCEVEEQLARIDALEREAVARDRRNDHA